MNFPQVIERIQRNTTPFLSKILTPAKLNRAFSLAPFSLNKSVIEKLLNFIFKSQIALGDFEFLSDRNVQISIVDANFNISLSFRDAKFICLTLNKTDQLYDARLSLNTIDAISLILQERDPDTLFFQRKLKISGNTELAHQLKNTIDTLDPATLPNFIKQALHNYRRLILEE